MRVKICSSAPEAAEKISAEEQVRIHSGRNTTEHIFNNQVRKSLPMIVGNGYLTPKRIGKGKAAQKSSKKPPSYKAVNEEREDKDLYI